MVTRTPPASPCLLLTATIDVKSDMVFTARADRSTRLEDYKQALSRWLAHPDVSALVLVENSGASLDELAAIASRWPNKQVELLSFVAPPFDGSLGKGYGEMICLQYALEHSELLAASTRLLKVTGRYYLSNLAQLLRFAEARGDAEVICDLLSDLTWADSRAFLASTSFLQTYLFPLRDEINDSQGANFEHVLARAVHACMSAAGRWAEPPFPLEIEGVSGSQDRRWGMGLKDRIKLRLRHRLFARLLASGPR